MCVNHARPSVFPSPMTSLGDSSPNLPKVWTCKPSPRVRPFVLPSRWVRAAAVRWPSCPQCLEPAGCCWWGWPCPQTTGWSWWRASSCSRTRAWRWRWHCIRASGEFASWPVGRCVLNMTTGEDGCMLAHTHRHTHTSCSVCLHMPAWGGAAAYEPLEL